MSETQSHFINGQWIAGDGEPLTSTNPATGEQNWQGRAATEPEIDRAIQAARAAFEPFADLPLADRIRYVQAVADQYKQRKPELTSAISRETGKPRWEAATEVDAMIAKIPISIEAHQQRAATVERDQPGAKAAARFRPHGVVAVFGPFNMPGHLPNGHLVPALLAGNTAVFKPSEQAPLVGQIMIDAWQAAVRLLNLPAGIINLIQGGPQTGAALAQHPGLDGLLFTGSVAGGQALHRTLIDHPERILALEMGGNNPLIVHEASDLRAAAYMTVQSIYITAGQRCSAARRLILVHGREADAFLDELTDAIAKIRVGLPTDEPEPFMGTVISETAATNLLQAQANRIRAGARALVEMKPDPRSPALLTPGLLDVTPMNDRPDAELFGPLLQVIRMPTFDAAIREANNTRFGLSAGLISDRRENYDRFYRRIRAGVVNFNRPLTGASSQLPFGGVGQSGNHRPSAYLAADYCTYPVASLEADHPVMPAQLPPGISP